MEVLDIHAGEIVAGMKLSVRVRGAKMAFRRMRLAVLLIRLAAAIGGTGLDIRFD